MKGSVLSYRERRRLRAEFVVRGLQVLAALVPRARILPSSSLSVVWAIDQDRLRLTWAQAQSPSVRAAVRLECGYHEEVESLHTLPGKLAGEE